MALITCPDCNHSVSDAAPACLHCGRPTGAAVALSSAPAVPQEAFGGRVVGAPSRFACPACETEDVKRLSIIWREGLTEVDEKTRSTTAGFGCAPLLLALPTAGLSLVFGLFAAHSRGRVRGEHQTLASKGSAPPKKLGYGTALVVGFVLPAVLGMLVGPSAVVINALLSVVGLGLMVYLGVRAFKYNRDQYPVETARWERSFRCSRCEHVFEPAA